MYVRYVCTNTNVLGFFFSVAAVCRKALSEKRVEKNTHSALPYENLMNFIILLR